MRPTRAEKPGLYQVAPTSSCSRNTVTTQVMAIHRKLWVSTRDQAVQRARELGLLDAPPLE